MSDDKKRPPGGYTFEAVKLLPEGWVVLSPWVTNLDGYWYRESILDGGWREEAEHAARHLADQLNGKK